MLVFTREAVRGQVARQGAGPNPALENLKRHYAGFRNLFGKNGRLIGRMPGFDTEIQGSAAKTQPVRAERALDRSKRWFLQG